MGGSHPGDSAVIMAGEPGLVCGHEPAPDQRLGHTINHSTMKRQNVFFLSTQFETIVGGSYYVAPATNKPPYTVKENIWFLSFVEDPDGHTTHHHVGEAGKDSRAVSAMPGAAGTAPCKV